MFQRRLDSSRKSHFWDVASFTKTSILFCVYFHKCTNPQKKTYQFAKKAGTLFCLEKFNAISPPPSSIIYLHHMKFGDHLWCFSSEYNAMEHPRKKYARQNDDKPICLTSQKCFLMSSQILPRILQITRHESFPRKKHNQFLVFTGLN